jgi:hypothetical protein
MGRKRLHADAAMRQKAYRERLQPQNTQEVPKIVARRQSRPARLEALVDATQILHREYEAWLDSLPETLEASAQYERVSETVDQLATIVDLFQEIEPPRGFGRD